MFGNVFFFVVPSVYIALIKVKTGINHLSGF